jgi:hypothetical protein
VKTYLGSQGRWNISLCKFSSELAAADELHFLPKIGL